MNEYEKMFNDIVMDSDAQCPSDIKASIDYVLNKIKEEPRSILILRYGLYGNEPCTYKQIAQKRGISFDAARNRYAKAMRIVRNPKNYIFIKYGIQAAEKILEERNREPNMEQKDSFEEFCMYDIKDAFSFSVRTYNALKRGGINTVKQLISHNDDELLKIRNLGRKSVDETIDAIKNALEKFNLSREEYLKSLDKD